MNKYTKGKVNLIQGDCMDLMESKPDNYYDLAVVDPPYGLGDRLVNGGHKKNPMEKFRKDYESKRWDDAPDEKYFNELFRISKDQIIWGGNYFDLPPTRCVLCWDKKQMMPTFSRWEMGWTSFDRPAKIFEGVVYDKHRTHPTQKPVKLYDWIFHNYAKPDFKILDTHGGSMSSAIAAYYFGCEFDCIELDKDYYNDAVKRFKEMTIQVKTEFKDIPKPEFKQQKIF